MGHHGLNGWGIYGLNGRGIYDLNGWGIYDVNGWGSYGKVCSCFLEDMLMEEFFEWNCI